MSAPKVPDMPTTELAALGWTSAQIARVHGWTPGTVLYSPALDRFLLVTGTGAHHVLAVAHPTGAVWEYERESVWDLGQTDWRLCRHRGGRWEAIPSGQPQDTTREAPQDDDPGWRAREHDERVRGWVPPSVRGAATAGAVWPATAAMPSMRAGTFWNPTADRVRRLENRVTAWLVLGVAAAAMSVVAALAFYYWTAIYTLISALCCAVIAGVYARKWWRMR